MWWCSRRHTRGRSSSRNAHTNSTNSGTDASFTNRHTYTGAADDNADASSTNRHTYTGATDDNTDAYTRSADGNTFFNTFSFTVSAASHWRKVRYIGS